MTNYYEQLTKEQKKEILNSLEIKMKDIQDTIDMYRRTMNELDSECWQIATCASMIAYWKGELSKVLDTIRLITSED